MMWVVGTVGIRPFGSSTTAPSGPAAVGAWKQQADLLLDRQPGEQVGDPLVDGPARVLVGGHHAVLVQVAEPDPVLVQDPDGSRRPGAGGYVLVSHRDSIVVRVDEDTTATCTTTE